MHTIIITYSSGSTESIGVLYDETLPPGDPDIDYGSNKQKEVKK